MRVGISKPLKRKRKKNPWALTWDYYGAEFFHSRKEAMECAVKARMLGKGGIRLSKWNKNRRLWEDVRL